MKNIKIAAEEQDTAKLGKLGKWLEILFLSSGRQTWGHYMVYPLC